MKIKPIKTEKDYETALKRIDELFDTVKKGTPEGDEFEILTILVEKYEDEHFPMDPPDPIEAIKFTMEQRGMKPKDLEPIVGDKGTVTKLLNKKLPLSLTMIRNLQKSLNISADVLVSKY
ncbi:MAG: transcriptional regulator [Bacteroidetes bacterium]|nr:transcriptional regulator [Bacteroidota bacterium]